jgi:hypothetical protein
MPKKKKKSGWTLKSGQSVEDWLDDRRARDRAKLSVEEQLRTIRQGLGYADDEDDDASVKKEDAPVQVAE